MELRELAERVLFGESLEDKLFSPSTVSDRQPGPCISAPQWPGRPPGLKAVERVETPFPSPALLVNDEDRGRALGCFANHELLAIEIMALALLRFPDAPDWQRRELLATLRDEQRHFRLYLHRMSQLGAELGAGGLNSFFWRIFRGMEGMEQLAAGMSLCLEQANLDHAIHFRSLFKEIGDLESARILDIVLSDEIIHVRRGVGWLKNQVQDKSKGCLWDHWLAALPAPLTPARARGARVHVQPRRAAGLGPRYIRRLKLWGLTKGQPGQLWIFNPELEEELRGHPRSRASQRLRKDQDALMTFLASPRDVIQVEATPREAWLEHLQNRGIPLPRYWAADSSERLGLSGETISGIRPWGWSPQLAERCGTLHSRLSTPLHLPSPAVMRNAGSKVHSHQVALDWLNQEGFALDSGQEWLALPEHLGGVESGWEAVVAKVQALQEAGWARVVLKSPWGTAGRGQRTCAVDDLAPARRWGERVLREQGGIRIEPWLDRVWDFSTQLRLRQGQAAVVEGHCQTLCDRSGQFTGAILGRFGSAAPPELRRFLFEDQRLERLSRELERLAPALMGPGWGDAPLGIDHFIYRDPEGTLRLRAVLECNPRLTMGRVALALQRRLCSRSVGLWRWIPREHLCASSEDLENQLFSLPHLLDEHERLQEGVICTNDPRRATLHVGLLWVNSDLKACTDGFQALLNNGRSGAGTPGGV